jgi:two-component system nitrate/nitrite response regulator NarL
MASLIKVAILEDHQSIIDGYMLRLQNVDDIELVDVVRSGDELMPMLQAHPEICTLIMDVHVPVSTDDKSNYFPILHLVPKIFDKRPSIRILIISMVKEPSLIKALMDAGVSGYIFKEDSDSIRKLASVIRMVCKGEVYLSEDARDRLNIINADNKMVITNRQLEILSLCAAYPDYSSEQIADMLGVAPSSLRTTLSDAYARLQVRTKAAAIARAKDMGLIS